MLIINFKLDHIEIIHKICCSTCSHNRKPHSKSQYITHLNDNRRYTNLFSANGRSFRTIKKLVFDADTTENVSSSLSRIILPTLEPSRLSQYQSFSTRIYKQILSISNPQYESSDAICTVSYVSRLKRLKIYSLERRRERLMILYIYKAITGLLQNPGLKTEYSMRTKTRIKPTYCHSAPA